MQDLEDCKNERLDNFFDPMAPDQKPALMNSQFDTWQCSQIRTHWGFMGRKPDYLKHDKDTDKSACKDTGKKTDICIGR